MESTAAIFRQSVGYVCSYHWFLESENLRCEKNSVSERNFFVHVRHFKHFFHFLVLRFGYDFVLILAGFGSGLRVSGNSSELYASPQVLHVLC